MVLEGRTVAVLGYGNQGSAQARNLRDSGVPVVVGNRADPYAEQARADDFTVVPIPEATAAGDLVLLTVPDEVQPELFTREVGPRLAAGATLVVASGYNVAFGLLDVPPQVDIVMVAPRMIGEAVRGRFLSGAGFPCLVSAERDVSGQAEETAREYAAAIGAPGNLAIASSAREEAALDLFSEQAVFPAILAAYAAAYEVLAAAGFSDEAILYELYLSAEPAEIFARAAERGLVDQLDVHSRTSQFGQLSTLLSADLAPLRDRFSAVLHDKILSGTFATEWSRRQDRAADLVAELHQRAGQLPLVRAERRVRERFASPAPSAAPA
jgi:ketol-acid reductoisomerase